MRTLTTRGSIASGLLVAALTACGGHSPGTRPQDMSAAAHDSAASEHDNISEGHPDQHAAGLGLVTNRCTPGPERICWSSAVGASEGHNSMAGQHRSIAAEHRTAAEALREAERRSCGGIAPEDRDQSPFFHRQDIRSVERLEVTVSDIEGPTETAFVGATIVFQAVPGLTAEWLQRAADCHLARNAVLGYPTTEMAYCPLNLRRVSARVRSVGDGFAVELSSPEPRSAAEILRRAEALVGAR